MAIAVKKKLCKGSCNEYRYIWAKGMCKQCYYIKNPPKQLNRTKLTYRRKPTGEKKVFEEIWNERPHICVNCKDPLGNEAKTFHFAHIQSKKQHPELRLEKSNIALLCFDCHYQYDHGTKEGYNNRTKSD